VAFVAYDVLLELSSTELYDAGLKVPLLFLSPLPFFVARPEVVDEGLNVDLACNFRLGCCPMTSCGIVVATNVTAIKPVIVDTLFILFVFADYVWMCGCLDVVVVVVVVVGLCSAIRLSPKL